MIELRERICYAALIHENMLSYVLGDEMYHEFKRWFLGEGKNKRLASIYTVLEGVDIGGQQRWVQRTIILGRKEPYPEDTKNMFISLQELVYFLKDTQEGFNVLDENEINLLLIGK
jgi:hypothetical protein